MRSRFSGSLLLFLFLVTVQTFHAKPSAESLARQAASTGALESGRAIAELRELGPAGLETLRRVHAEEINRQIANPLLAATPEWQRLSLALDTVSQQKDSYLSGLYWYTDLNQAKLASRQTGKPILSLRLLGKLNEEFSCANSRFFRTILYSNEEISKTLREKFILHWQSERPAPRVTIDFGDGRKLERTLTGNSVHYVLDSDGRPLDALPGLYGPQAFARQLENAQVIFRSVQGTDGPQKESLLADYYRKQNNRISIEWLNETTNIGGKLPSGLVIEVDHQKKAIAIAPLAVTKAVTETSVLKSINAGAEALGKITDEVAWTKIAFRHIQDAKLDERSIGLMKRQTKELFKAADSSGLTPDMKMMNLLQRLQLNVALDTVRNEYLLHTKLYAWLTTDKGRSDLEGLNKKVYAELFLTPASDPWLGLFSAETYVAIDGGGVVR
jgi:hypothetical protein